MNFLNFRSTQKNALSEFNLEEITGWMIQVMIRIEKKIDIVILEYFQPKLHNEFDRIVLNSSVLSIGAKIKDLRNVAGFKKNIIDKIQKISNIRNAFAHLTHYESVKIDVSEDNNGQVFDSKIEVTTKIEIMTSNGKLKIYNSKEQVLKFFELQNELLEYFNKFK